MTREEAITHLLHDWHINLGCEFAIKPGRLDDFLTALDVALTALRGPTREMVERMRGEWIEDEFAISHCSLCGYEQEEPELITPFCPLCGRPMTDEAVDMMLERWKEAVKDAVD